MRITRNSKSFAAFPVVIMFGAILIMILVSSGAKETIRAKDKDTLVVKPVLISPELDSILHTWIRKTKFKRDTTGQDE